MTPAMSDPCEKEDCDKQCGDHKTTVLLLEQHTERIGTVEDMALDISVDFSNLEGRVNTFIWIIGVSFFLLCSIAFYGAVQIDRFKDLYMSDTKENALIMAELRANVLISTEHIEDIREDIEKFHKE